MWLPWKEGRLELIVSAQIRLHHRPGSAVPLSSCLFKALALLFFIAAKCPTLSLGISPASALPEPSSPTCLPSSFLLSSAAEDEKLNLKLILDSKTNSYWALENDRTPSSLCRYDPAKTSAPNSSVASLNPNPLSNLCFSGNQHAYAFVQAVRIRDATLTPQQQRFKSFRNTSTSCHNLAIKQILHWGKFRRSF